MANYVPCIVILFAMIVLAAAKPFPGDQDGQEILNGAETRYGGLPLFWFQRPLRDDDGYDYGADDGGYAKPGRHYHKSPLPLYENSGAGWGR